MTRLGHLYRCLRCRRQVSVTSGTAFHRSHLPLPMWFRAMWWVASQKNGASALGLKRILGLGSYETAWLMLHKLRRAMVRPGRDRLEGSVEVDETYIGGLEEGLRGRQVETKTLVVVAAQTQGKRIGRIRMKRIADASSQCLLPFITASIAPGSTVITDAWSGYSGVEELGYRHRTINLSRSRQSPSDLLPRVHRVASLLKRWLMGTYQGAVSYDHLDYYYYYLDDSRSASTEDRPSIAGSSSTVWCSRPLRWGIERVPNRHQARERSAIWKTPQIGGW